MLLLLLSLGLRLRGSHHELLLAELLVWLARGLHQTHQEGRVAVDVLVWATRTLAGGVLALVGEIVNHRLRAGRGLANSCRSVAQ
jgi:hypothetical protein